jgi:hypothetical protein
MLYLQWFERSHGKVYIGERESRGATFKEGA